MSMTEGEIWQRVLEFLRIPSVTGSPGEEQACAFLERILDGYGIGHHRVSRNPARPNLVAKIPAANPTQPPMLLISHIDVVDGSEEAWCI